MSIAYEDTPIADWLKKNRWILIGGVLAILAIQGYYRFAPQLQAQSLDRSWTLYNTLMTDAGPTGLDNLNDRLGRARQDDRIHPWFVYQMTAAALREDDREALNLLQGELKQLPPDTRWLVGGETVVLASYLDEQIQARSSSSAADLSNPPATEELVEIALTDSENNTYTLTATLYPEAAPEACAALLAAIDSGAFADGSVAAVGRSHLTVPGLGDPDADPLPTLPLERKFGYGAAEGALMTSMPVGGPPEGMPGAQSGTGFQIQLSAAHHLDGRQSVFGQITEGLEPVLEAVESGSGLTFSLAGISRAEG